MTRNRTAPSLLSTCGTELLALLLVTLAIGLAVNRYVRSRREDLRRSDCETYLRVSRFGGSGTRTSRRQAA